MRADIHDGQELERSINGPDTEAQDQPSSNQHFRLATRGRSIQKGHDTISLEHKMWKLLDARGAQYPAEHNVGQLYEAEPSLINHYKTLDPCNSFNPGIGRTSKRAHWR